MVLSFGFAPAKSFARGHLACSRADRSRSHYFASCSHASGTGESNKAIRKKTQARGFPAGSVLGGLTIQPLQQTNKSKDRPWSSGIVCTQEECNFKADERTTRWLRELFDGLDSDRCSHRSLV